MNRFRRPLAVALLTAALAGAATYLGSQPSPPGPAPLPPARPVPGINAADRFPTACVDCHVELPEMDFRLSTLMAGWTEKVDPKLLVVAQQSAPAGVTLAGRHPQVAAALDDVPRACLECHGKESKQAPPFARLLHHIHLGPAPENHFMALFQGECTHCHKLDAASGAWSLPSGKEK